MDKVIIGVKPVQIPLWSMNTKFPFCLPWDLMRFRFLYGRWIRWTVAELEKRFQSSDSSMVDEYADEIKATVLAVAFRFLYGRWIRGAIKGEILDLYSSDSSMVDEYQGTADEISGLDPVQIPLWSMNTSIPPLNSISFQLVQIPLWSMNTNFFKFVILVNHVQIPLWSMNTNV